MPIPKYDEMYLAFLECLADGQTHKSKEVKDAVADIFAVSEKERAELLPSGKQRLFDNRIGWTCTYLKKAGKSIARHLCDYASRQTSPQRKSYPNR